MQNQISIRTVKESHVPLWTLADRLKKTRAETGLSAVNFAKMTSLSPRQITYSETGKGEVSDVILIVYAAKTGVDYHWLRTGKTSEAYEIELAQMELLLGLDSNQEPIGSYSPSSYHRKVEPVGSFLDYQIKRLKKAGGDHAFINRLP